jgi:hypothetical protein
MSIKIQVGGVRRQNILVFSTYIISSDIYNINDYRKVGGSISDEVICLNLPNPSSRTRPWGLLSL